MIRPLDPVTDLDAVIAAYSEAADYWTMAEGTAPDATSAATFFTDCPPGGDPARSHRLGLFVGNRLSGLAELSFGFPTAKDAYLGQMILAPRIRGSGHGRTLLAEVERRARAEGARDLYLAVLDVNARGRAFWEREGFRATGVSLFDEDTGHLIHRMVKPLTL